MKKLFLILIAFFSVSAFSQDPFNRKQREQTEYPKEGSPYRQCRLACIRS